MNKNRTDVLVHYDQLPPSVKTSLRDRWFCPEDPARQRMRHMAMRKEITLPPDRAGLCIYVTAGTLYRLYVDGNFLAAGPAPCIGSNRFVDRIPLDHLKHLSRITLALEWVSIPYPGKGSSEFPEHDPGITCEVFDGETLVQPDTNWKIREFHAYRQDTRVVGNARLVPTEDLDCARMPPDWRSSGFDDSDWSAAEENTGACPRLLARPVPMPGFEEHIFHQLREAGRVLLEDSSDPDATGFWRNGRFIPDGGTECSGGGFVMQAPLDNGVPYLILDLDQVHAGNLTLEASLPDGAVLHGAFIQEMDRFNGQPWRRFVYNQPSRFTFTLRGNGGLCPYESFHLFSGRHLLLVATGLKNFDKIILHRAGVRNRSALPPGTQSAWLSTSDKHINHLFRESIRAMRVNTLDFPIDGMPDENKIYLEYCGRPGYPAFHLFHRQSPGHVLGVLDMVLETRGGRKDWPDMPEAAVRQTTYPFFNSDTVFSFIHAVFDRCRYLGETPAERHLHAMAAMLDALHEHANDMGLLESLPNTAYGQSVCLTMRGRPESNPRFQGVHVVTNADYYLSLCMMDRMASNPRFRGRASKLKQGMNALIAPFLEKNEGSRMEWLVPDVFLRTEEGLKPFGVPEVHIFEAKLVWRSEATQYTLIESGILEARYAERLWDVLRSWRPYRIPTEDDAIMYHPGRTAVFPSNYYRYRKLLREGRGDLLYSELADVYEQTNFLSQWAAADGRERCGGGIEMSMYATVLFEGVAGIQPGEAGGYRHSRIRPLPAADMRWARAWLHTGEGVIGIHWAYSPDRFELTVTLPAGHSADVILPPCALNIALRGGQRIAPGASYSLDQSILLCVTESEGVQFFPMTVSVPSNPNPAITP